MGTMVDSWFDAFMLGFTLVTAALQLYTLVLEVKISPKEMRTYRWFLCICMTLDLLFDLLIGLGVAPRFTMPACLAIEVRGFFALFGPSGGKIAIFMGCSLFGMTAFFLLFSLVYRLAVIQYRYPRLAEHLADWKSLLAGAAFASALLVVFCRITNDIIITPEIPLVANSSVLCQAANIPWYQPGQVLVGPDLDQMAGNAVVILCTIFIPLTITVIAYGSSTIFILRLREHTYSMSAKTYRMHIRIIVLVLLQLTMPMVFVAAPVVIAVIVMCLVGKGKGDSNAMIGYPSYQLGDTAVLMLLSYGLVNVFLTIGFITPYRRFTMAVLHGHWSEAGKAWRLEETVSVGTGNNNGGQVQQQTVTRNQLRGRSDGRLVMMERRQQGRGSGVAPARGITAGSSSRISCKK